MSTTQIDRDYARRLSCAASRERVFEALATTSGLAGWWTPEVSGWPGPGGRLELRFAGADTIRLSVEAAAPGSRVVWRVQENTGRPEWRGTRITFVLASDGPGRTLIDFRHAGLDPELECYDICSRGWDHFLQSLIDFAESGLGSPWKAVALAA